MQVCLIFDLLHHIWLYITNPIPNSSRAIEKQSQHAFWGPQNRHWKFSLYVFENFFKIRSLQRLFLNVIVIQYRHRSEETLLEYISPNMLLKEFLGFHEQTIFITSYPIMMMSRDFYQIKLRKTNHCSFELISHQKLYVMCNVIRDYNL